MLISIFGVEDQQCQKNQLRHSNYGFWDVTSKDQLDGETVWSWIKKGNRNGEEKIIIIN